MDKEQIRSKIRASKALLTHSEKITAAERVWRMIEQTAAFIMADRVLLYHSLPDELDTRGFLAKWHSRKRFFLPRVNGVNLDILPFDAATLSRGILHHGACRGRGPAPRLDGSGDCPRCGL